MMIVGWELENAGRKASMVIGRGVVHLYSCVILMLWSMDVHSGGRFDSFNNDMAVSCKGWREGGSRYRGYTSRVVYGLPAH